MISHFFEQRRIEQAIRHLELASSLLNQVTHSPDRIKDETDVIDYVRKSLEAIWVAGQTEHRTDGVKQRKGRDSLAQ